MRGTELSWPQLISLVAGIGIGSYLFTRPNRVARRSVRELAQRRGWRWEPPSMSHAGLVIHGTTTKQLAWSIRTTTTRRRVVVELIIPGLGAETDFEFAWKATARPDYSGPRDWMAAMVRDDSGATASRLGFYSKSTITPTGMQKFDGLFLRRLRGPRLAGLPSADAAAALVALGEWRDPKVREITVYRDPAGLVIKVYAAGPVGANAVEALVHAGEALAGDLSRLE